MDIVGAVASSTAVPYRGELDKDGDTGSNNRTVESAPTGPTSIPQDSDVAGRTEPPIVQLVRKSAENIAANFVESGNPTPEGGITGSQVDMHA